ncbi:YceI family protein [Isoptericola sp. b441]|uniref:YceI family protein n=1 Tax=Actinotalea lenta TaxID=3064654 RepID=A0ABT9DB58_9CELL|nr:MULTISPECIES: YceI family protein [unclassified Isoptericola]MDO8108134.1 YceI family protein [Isoptericola sp. b441]MDO8120196.1 YceI family protein [Isoptericola sp. b490]
MERHRHGRPRDSRRGPRPAGIGPEHRRRWVVVTIVALVLAVGAVTGGPWVYARVMDQRAPGPLTLPSQTVDSALAASGRFELNGRWLVAQGSQAGYRIGEVLNGSSVEVVGRTDKVSGTATVSGNDLASASIEVEVGSITTDQSARDVYFRRALDTSTYPTATFELTEPVDLSGLAGGSGPVTVSAPGTLTIGAATVDVTAELDVRRADDGLEVAGKVPVTLSDLDLTAPDLGFVTVEPQGTVEFLLLMSH